MSLIADASVLVAAATDAGPGGLGEENALAAVGPFAPQPVPIGATG